MKKLFTLIAGILLASSASAQLRWTNVINNGDLEDEDYSSYWVQEWRNVGDEERTDGQPNVIEDPAQPGNHVVAVRARSTEENNGESLERYDTQFFITVGEQELVGKEIRISVKIKADKAAHIGTQCHAGPGQYIGYDTFGGFDVTTEWKVFEWEGLAPDATNSDTGDSMHTIAFDLCDYKDGNTYYFDDVKFDVRDPKDPAEFEGWYNFLRNGTLSEDVMPQNSNYYNFTGRDGIDGVDRKARVVNDPVDGQPALNVTTVCIERSEEVPALDEEGNPVLDDEGNPTYNTVNYWTKKFTNEDGTVKDSVMTRGIDDWESQFFVSIPHTLGQGQKFRVRFSARADLPCQIQSQVHTNPGGYVWYEGIGNFDLTEDWQDFDTDELTISSNQKGIWTIAFNCNVKKDEVNNIYFRFEEFSINSAEVTEEDRVLASEDVIGQVPAIDADGTKMTIDVTKALEVLGLASAEDLLEGKAYVKVSFKDDEDNLLWQDVQPDYYIDANGYYAEEGINIAYNEDDTAGNVVSFDIFNEGVDVTGAIATKLIFSVPEDATPEDGYARRAWSYEYNISLMGKEAYEEALAVTDVKSASKKSGAIYDLSGRRVVKAAKGLYIKDGKKFFVK